MIKGEIELELGLKEKTELQAIVEEKAMDFVYRNLLEEFPELEEFKDNVPYIKNFMQIKGLELLVTGDADQVVFVLLKTMSIAEEVYKFENKRV